MESKDKTADFRINEGFLLPYKQKSLIKYMSLFIYYIRYI